MLAERQIMTLTSPQLLIDLPKSFANRRVEVLVLALDEMVPVIKKRTPPPELAGRVREKGDVMTSTSPLDWGIEE